MSIFQVENKNIKAGNVSSSLLQSSLNDSILSDGKAQNAFRNIRGNFPLKIFHIQLYFQGQILDNDSFLYTYMLYE